MFLNKNITRPKAVSLIMVLIYGMILFGFASLLVSLIFASQKFAYLSERFNMSYYSAESGIEQALFEINLHDVGFSDSTLSFTGMSINGDLVDSDGYMPLDSSRITYMWDVSGVSGLNTETGYLVYSNDLEGVVNDSKKDFYDNFRRLYFYHDTGSIGSGSVISNTCVTSYDLEVQFSVDGSNLIHDGKEGEVDRVIYWSASGDDVVFSVTGAILSSTGYVIEPRDTCLNPDSNNVNPFCYFYSTSDTFSFAGNFNLHSTDNIGICKNSVGNYCKGDIASSYYSVLNFYNTTVFQNNIYKPTMTFNYVTPLYEAGNDGDYVPIRYVITNNSPSTCELPSLTIDISSFGKVYGSFQELRASINQGSKGIDLDYAVIQ